MGGWLKSINLATEVETVTRKSNFLEHLWLYMMPQRILLRPSMVHARSREGVDTGATCLALFLLSLYLPLSALPYPVWRANVHTKKPTSVFSPVRLCQEEEQEEQEEQEKEEDGVFKGGEGIPHSPQFFSDLPKRVSVTRRLNNASCIVPHHVLLTRP